MPVAIETGVAAERRNFLNAIILMCVSVLCFSLLDTCAKLLVRNLEPAQVVWARYFGHFALACIMVAPWRSRNLLKTRHPWLQMVLVDPAVSGRRRRISWRFSIWNWRRPWRSLFMAPLLVALFSIPLLGEYVGLRRWAAIIAGFIGIHHYYAARQRHVPVAGAAVAGRRGLRRSLQYRHAEDRGRRRPVDVTVLRHAHSPASRSRPPCRLSGNRRRGLWPGAR